MMTDIEQFHGEQLPLPGLEPAPRVLPPLVVALRRSIFALDRAELLEEAHALELAACHLLARSAEMKLATGKGSTIANDVELLLRTKQAIADQGAEVSTEADQKLLDAMAEWAEHIEETERAGALRDEHGE